MFIKSKPITWRTILILFFLIVALVILLVELTLAIPDILDKWLNDYQAYASWGLTELTGIDHHPAHLPNYYPYPTTLWIFVPLALLPSWFRIIWTIIPLVFVLWLHRKPGVILWMYYPLLIQTAVGSLDGVLLIPLFWLLENISGFAGIGAVLLLFKPQLSFGLVVYALCIWLIRRDWRNLGAFGVTLCVIYLPAFIRSPLWPITMIQLMGIRANEDLLFSRGASIWAWVWHGGWTLWLAPVVACLGLGLFVYVFIYRRKQFQAIQLLGLIVTPVLYASNFVTTVPILKTRQQIATMTIVSWVCVLVDALAGGWGGVYVFIPIAALYLLARDKAKTSQASVNLSR